MNCFLTFLTAFLLLSLFMTLKLNARTPLEKKPYYKVNYVQSTISGNVIDTNGLPISGVTIQVGKTNLGTISEFNGFYSIKALELLKRLVENPELEISMEPEESLPDEAPGL